MRGRVVLWGATGYTGRLVTESLVKLGEQPLLVGRDASRLRALSESHGGLDTAVADVERPESLTKLLAAGDVLISTVGPFTLYGKPALHAALDANAHYLDSTGESGFMREVFADAGPVARSHGTTLLTAFGYDYVPGNVAGAAAVDRAGPGARKVEIGYLLPPGVTGPGRNKGPVISTGTRASMLAIGAVPQHRLAGGRLILEPSAKNLKRFSVDGRERWASSVGGSEALALPLQYGQLEDVGIFMEFPGPPRIARGAAFGFSSALGALGRSAIGRRGIDAVVKKAASKTGGGPSAEAREKSGSLVVATCKDGSGKRLTAVKLAGPVNGYTLTGELIAWGASSLSAGRQLAAGAIGPVEAFGLKECIDAIEGIGLVLSDLDPVSAD